MVRCQEQCNLESRIFFRILMIKRMTKERKYLFRLMKRIEKRNNIYQTKYIYFEVIS